MADASLFEELGGATVLRKIIDRFVDRIFDDVMIGFLFARASRERVKEKEYEFAAKHLGGPVEYTGRPLDEAHRRHAIMSGQFNRRLTILKETLEEFGVPPRVQEHWLAHTRALMSQVMQGSHERCEPPAPSGKHS